jgi:hypothetical protein
MDHWAIPVIAATAALIAYLQWVTAHQKVVVELFDKRLAAFLAVRDALIPVMRNAAMSNEEFNEFVRAKDRCQFLFGDGVHHQLSEITNDLAFMSAYSDQLIRKHPNGFQLLDKKTEILIRLGEFHKTTVPIFAQYMKLDQKMKYFWPTLR